MAVEYWLILISCPHNTVSYTKEVFVDDATVPTEWFLLFLLFDLDGALEK